MVLTVAALLGACGGGGEAAAPSTVATTTTPTTMVPVTQPPTTINALERRKAENEFTDYYHNQFQHCFDNLADCLALNVPFHTIFKVVHDRAVAIPGDDAAPMTAEVNSTWLALDACWTRTNALDQCGPEDSAFETAAQALYDGLR